MCKFYDYECLCVCVCVCALIRCECSCAYTPVRKGESVVGLILMCVTRTILKSLGYLASVTGGIP